MEILIKVISKVCIVLVDFEIGIVYVLFVRRVYLLLFFMCISVKFVGN